MTKTVRPLAAAGILLGIGMGGFFDGIVFHQILQLHNMLTGKIPKDSLANMEVNMFWDGLFHAFTWGATLTGIILLFRAGAQREAVWSGRSLGAAMFLGWGVFNLVEGVVDHYLLQLHHVVERLGVSMYDHFFAASGIVLMLGGWWGIKADSKRTDGNGPRS